jgi:hypothetical protein
VPIPPILTETLSGRGKQPARTTRSQDGGINLYVVVIHHVMPGRNDWWALFLDRPGPLKMYNFVRLIHGQWQRHEVRGISPEREIFYQGKVLVTQILPQNVATYERTVRHDTLVRIDHPGWDEERWVKNALQILVNLHVIPAQDVPRLRYMGLLGHPGRTDLSMEMTR